jgi:diguanylate cyclase (GGDEF)-like protein
VISPLRQRLGLGERGIAAFLVTSDPTVMARALMYLVAALGTAIVASIAIPGAPLAHEKALPILVAIAYACAIGVLVGFDKLPRWGFHALVLAMTALVSWAIYRSGSAGSPYTIFFVWVAMYAAFFMTPAQTAAHIAVMLGAYGGVLIALGDKTLDPSLHWALTASALVLVGVAIQALIAHVRRLVDRLTQVGRGDSITGLYNSEAFDEMLDNEVERARRSGNRLGLIVAEIEGFPSAPAKSSLPPAQQKLLTAIGELLGSTPRQIDVAARLGDGGRFALLLPYTDEHGAYLLAERVRSRAEVIESPEGGRVRMSFGVASFPRHGASASAILQAAEAALGEAIESGGDRVMLLQRSASSARVELDAQAPAAGTDEPVVEMDGPTVEVVDPDVEFQAPGDRRRRP